MDPILKYHDIFLKRYRPPRHKTSSNREFPELQPREPSSNFQEVLESKYTNRIIGLTSPGRRIKIPARNGTVIPEPPRSGKENRSASSNPRRKTERTLGTPVAGDRSLVMDMHEIENKHPELLQKIQIYMNNDPKTFSRRESSARTPSAQRGHRRFASQLSSQPRAKSNDRRSTIVSKNNSILNNTSLIEEHLNNSKESSYLREHNDISYLYSNPQSAHMRIYEDTHHNDGVPEMILQDPEFEESLRNQTEAREDTEPKPARDNNFFLERVS